MKAGTFILSFLFVVLTIQPAFIRWNDISCGKETTAMKMLPKSAGCSKKAVAKTCTAKKEKQPVPAKQQTEDPCNTCNPFMSCNACPYMPAELQSLFSPLRINVENTDGSYDASLPSFEADCWHPPELFMRL